jgi:hypothetical protein
VENSLKNTRRRGSPSTVACEHSEDPAGSTEANLEGRASQRIKEEAVEVGQKVVFVRDVKGAEVGKQGTVMDVSDDVVVVGCRLDEHLAPVLAQMWDVLPERLWDRLLKRRSGTETNDRSSHR